MSPAPGAPAPSCPNCGRPLAASASFCRHCGTAAPAQAPSSAAAAPGQRRQGGGRGRTGALVAFAVLAGLLIGGGAVAAVALLGGESSDEPSAVVPETAATVPTDETAPPEARGEADAPTEPAVPAGFPSADRVQMAAEIQSALLAFHEAVVARRFQDAWSLLSPRKRRQTEREDGYRKWARAQASLSDYLSPAGMTVRIDALEDDGVARVLVTGMGWSAPGASCAEWSGLTWVKYEGGAWAYDPGYSTTPERERAWKSRYGQLLGAGC